ncbi:MAG: hypothetical protein INR70_44705, partial [Parafilimonas terrae]|nr:hypothetical protein [Parafilimonas terrae]
CGDGLSGSQLGANGDPLWRASTFSPVTPGPFAGSQLGADGDPLEHYTPALDLECELRRLVPPHVRLHWRYELPATP